MLATVHPTLNNHEYNMKPACVVHAVWCHFVLEPSTSLSQVLWSVLWLRHHFVTAVTVWLINPNPSCSKNRKMKKERKEKWNKVKRDNKIKSTVNDLDKLSLDKDFITYFEIRSRGMSRISRFLITLLDHGDFSFESTQWFIEVYGEVAGLGESDIMFGVNSDVWMISLISEKWGNTGSCTRSIIIGKLCKR